MSGTLSFCDFAEASQRLESTLSQPYRLLCSDWKVDDAGQLLVRPGTTVESRKELQSAFVESIYRIGEALRDFSPFLQQHEGILIDAADASVRVGTDVYKSAHHAVYTTMQRLVSHLSRTIYRGLHFRDENVEVPPLVYVGISMPWLLSKAETSAFLVGHWALVVAFVSDLDPEWEDGVQALIVAICRERRAVERRLEAVSASPTDCVTEGDLVKRLALAYPGDEGARILQICSNTTLTVEQKMWKICGIDPAKRSSAFSSIDWAKLIGCSESAVRNNDCWKKLRANDGSLD